MTFNQWYVTVGYKSRWNTAVYLRNSLEAAWDAAVTSATEVPKRPEAVLAQDLCCLRAWNHKDHLCDLRRGHSGGCFCFCLKGVE